MARATQIHLLLRAFCASFVPRERRGLGGGTVLRHPPGAIERWQRSRAAPIRRGYLRPATINPWDTAARVTPSHRANSARHSKNPSSSMRRPQTKRSRPVSPHVASLFPTRTADRVRVSNV